MTSAEADARVSVADAALSATSPDVVTFWAEQAHADDAACLPVPDGYEWEELADGVSE